MQSAVGLLALLCIFCTTISGFILPSPSVRSSRHVITVRKGAAVASRQIRLMAATDDEPVVGPQGPPGAGPVIAPEKPPVPEEELTPEQKAQKEKAAKIAELRAKEVFDSTETGDYECQICGWKYLQEKGVGPYKPGTPFAAVAADFKCPNCKAGKNAFKPIMKTIAGFSDNRQYGFGGNNLTSEQKGGLIFGGLFFFFVLFLSGYLLE